MLTVAFDGDSPAHAGIDLHYDQAIKDGIRFPRTRGDRPPKLIASLGAVAIPPHHAGIDPIRRLIAW